MNAAATWNPRLRALQYPDSWNPYLRCLREALAHHGVDVEVVGSPWRLFVASLHDRPDVLHLHWVHPHGRNAVVTLAKFCLIQAGIRLFRIRGIRIVWTIHNLESHEKNYLGLDRLNSRLVARQVDAALVHARAQIGTVCRILGLSPKKVHHVPHGNYVSCVPDPFQSPRRHESGSVRTETHFLYFGLIRPYKGVLELIEAFRELDGRATLTIAGRPQDEGMKQAVESAAAMDPRIRLRLEYVSDEDLSTLIGECDVVVLPFTEIFTSGSVVMAITCAKAVIVPDGKSLREYIDESCAFLYRPDEPVALKHALQRAHRSSVLQEMGKNARRMALALDWAHIARTVASVYRSERTAVELSRPAPR